MHLDRLIPDRRRRVAVRRRRRLQCLSPWRGVYHSTKSSRSPRRRNLGHGESQTGRRDGRTATLQALRPGEYRNEPRQAHARTEAQRAKAQNIGGASRGYAIQVGHVTNRHVVHLWLLPPRPLKIKK